MPNIIVPNEALTNWANLLIAGEPTLTDCYLRLFSSAVDINTETTLAELDAAESAFSGYEPQQLVNWSAAIIEANDALTEADPAIFQADADSDDEIFGCYATTSTEPKLLFAVRFATPVSVPYETELRAIIALYLRSIFTT